MSKRRRSELPGKPASSLTISRAEIWLIDLDPSVGAEMRKTRPVVVVSSDLIGALPIKLVAPLTEWKEHFAENAWHVQVIPDSTNGLKKVSAVDTLQLRGVDTARFIQKLGSVTPSVMASVIAAIGIVIQE
jgi:mRNA interferase MazF